MLDLFDLFWLQLGVISLRVSVFGDHIAHVVSMSADKQMIWINAGRIIAAMEHTVPIRDFATEHLIGCSMSKFTLSIE